jgi:hypothetical protein
VRWKREEFGEREGGRAGRRCRWSLLPSNERLLLLKRNLLLSFKKKTQPKTDPYLNTDAGTMSPFEHGEVFVLDDGGEVNHWEF